MNQLEVTVWAFPEPPILLSLNRLGELLVHDVDRRPPVAFPADDTTVARVRPTCPLYPTPRDYNCQS